MQSPASLHSRPEMPDSACAPAACNSQECCGLHSVFYSIVFNTIGPRCRTPPTRPRGVMARYARNESKVRQGGGREKRNNTAALYTPIPAAMNERAEWRRNGRENR
jgi:hypothetical protein